MEFKSNILKQGTIDMSSRTFEGYASTWDEDQVGDIIHQGAFKKSIIEGLPANRIKVLWQHDQPLGMPVEMSENDHGLYVKGKISRTRLGDEALELMRDGVVDRMSIGFSIPAGKSFFDEAGRRNITEVKLMEFSPVTFPANESAVITSVKSLSEQILIAKSKGLVVNDSAELCKMLTELKALLEVNEPLQDTRINEAEPLITECKDILHNLGDFARKF